MIAKQPDPGAIERLHVVRHGDTLSGIAHHFKLQSWHPIYNVTRLRTGLWKTHGTKAQHDNPDLIRVGDVVVIPRSRQGYQKTIAKISQLRMRLQAEPNEAAEAKKEMDEKAEQIDLISDVLTTVVSCGGIAVRGALEARALTGSSALRTFAKNSAMWKEIGKKVGWFAFEQGSDAVGDTAGKGLSTEHKLTETVDKGKEIKEAFKVAKNLRDAGMLLARGVEILLDYVHPSTLAKAYLRLKNGEWPDEVVERIAKQNEQSKAMLLMHLNQKIQHLHQEQAQVYGK